jgi:hypothetical protein
MKSYTILFRGFPETGPLVEPVTACVTASTLGCALNCAVKRADEKIRAKHSEREADLPEKDRTKAVSLEKFLHRNNIIIKVAR